MGFVVSIVEEAMTGRGTLQQIGFDAPSTTTLALLCAVFGTATLAGTVDTVRKLVTRKMSPQDIARWACGKALCECGGLCSCFVRRCL